MKGSGRPSVAAAYETTVDGEIIEDEEGGGHPATALAAVRPAPLARPPVTAMVVGKPRNMQVVAKNVLDEAELIGEDFYYSWTTKSRDGDKIVEGPSIEGAMSLYRNFENVDLPTDIYEEGPDHWVFKAIFIDLEKGSTYPRLFRQRKGESHQRTGRDGDRDRKLDIAFQIGQSKAQRNAILKAMPAWLVNRAMEKAKESADANYRDKLPESIEKAKVAWSKVGISVAQLEKKLGKPVAAWTVSDCRTLVALHRGIMAHETTIENEFPSDAPPAQPAPPPTPMVGPATPSAASALNMNVAEQVAAHKAAQAPAGQQSLKSRE